jgi:very-short-patch-repair endonuclease
MATAQHGVIAVRQLMTLGYTRSQIRRRVEGGRLLRVHRGVYAVGHSRLTRRGTWMAAVLACGPDALLSHRSAGALWGIIRPASLPPDVTVPGARHQRPGPRLHSARGLTAADRAIREGIPLTGLPRTLLDLATVLRPDRLERAIEEAERLELFDLRAIDQLLAGCRGRRGVARLRAALSNYREPAFTRSELERRFLELVKAAGLPRPSANAWVEGHEVDALWWRERLVVELDGYEFHRTRAAHERDRRRDEELSLSGYQVIRLTWRRMERPDELARRLRRHLRRRRRELGLAA